jgi:tetratricopeptide (TPR) repeat protein
LRWKLKNEAYQLYVRGSMPEARVALDAALSAPADKYMDWFSVNGVICIDVADGRYARALTHRPALLPQLEPAELPDAAWWAEYETDLQVICINEAEALANLGQWAESLAWLDRVEMRAPIAVTGSALHRTWVHGVQGRAAEARAAFTTANLLDLPGEFRSEYFFSEAFLLLAELDYVAAKHAVQAGLDCAVRASSRRNALFLLATIAHRQGQLEEADRQFEQGANATYRGQGGASLLEWGDVLDQLGRPDAARRAWSLATERDPESPAAPEAQQRSVQCANTV